MGESNTGVRFTDQAAFELSKLQGSEEYKAFLPYIAVSVHYSCTICDYNCTVLLAIAQHVVDNHVVETQPVTLPQSSHSQNAQPAMIAQNKLQPFPPLPPPPLVSVHSEAPSHIVEVEDSLQSTVQFVYCEPVESSSECQSVDKESHPKTHGDGHSATSVENIVPENSSTDEKSQPVQNDVAAQAVCVSAENQSVHTSRTSVIVSCDESATKAIASEDTSDTSTTPKSIDGDAQLPLNKRGRPRLQFTPEDKSPGLESSEMPVRTRRQVAEKQVQREKEVEITSVVSRPRRRCRKPNQTNVKIEPGSNCTADKAATDQLRSSENTNRQGPGVKLGKKSIGIESPADLAGGDLSNDGSNGDRAGNSRPSNCDAAGDMHRKESLDEDKLSDGSWADNCEEKTKKRKAKIEPPDVDSTSKLLRGDREDLKARTCPFCGIVMEHISEVLPHYKSEHDYEPKAYKCDFNRAAQELNELSETSTKNTMKTMDNIQMCHICGKHLLKENLLKHIILKHVWRRHSQRISRAKPTMCHICGRVLSHTQNMDRHMKEHMGQVKKKKETSFMCDICGYTTPESSRLKYHYQAVHHGQMPFKCDECEYQTWEKSSFRCHMFTHTNDKKFKCSECPYQCIQKKQLRNHLTRHHGITMLKAYKREVSDNGKVKLKRVDKNAAEPQPPAEAPESAAAQPEYTMPEYPPVPAEGNGLMAIGGQPVCGGESVVETPQPSHHTVLVDEGLYHPAVSMPMVEVSAALPQQAVLHYLPQQVLRSSGYQPTVTDALLYSDLSLSTPQRMSMPLPTDTMTTLVQLTPTGLPLTTGDHNVDGGTLEHDIAQALIQIHPTPPQGLAQHADYLLPSDPHTIHHPGPL